MKINYFVTVKGPGLHGTGPFETGGPGFAIEDPDEDIEIDTDTGQLQITVAPRRTERGSLIEDVVRFPRGAWTHVTVRRVTKEA